CTRVNTPPWQQAKAIHSARRPFQPNGSSALARSLATVPVAAEPNRCSGVSMSETVTNRL
ncbi:MAG: hypothetical protein OXH66_15890, partial [Gemmatimonadetes bacterium]|nr:hypothetical protein [Gemmatimonadota bacterium]